MEVYVVQHIAVQSVSALAVQVHPGAAGLQSDGSHQLVTLTSVLYSTVLYTYKSTVLYSYKSTVLYSYKSAVLYIQIAVTKW